MDEQFLPHDLPFGGPRKAHLPHHDVYFGARGGAHGGGGVAVPAPEYYGTGPRPQAPPAYYGLPGGAPPRLNGADPGLPNGGGPMMAGGPPNGAAAAAAGFYLRPPPRNESIGELANAIGTSLAGEIAGLDISGNRSRPSPLGPGAPPPLGPGGPPRAVSDDVMCGFLPHAAMHGHGGPGLAMMLRHPHSGDGEPAAGGFGGSSSGHGVGCDGGARREVAATPRHHQAWAEQYSDQYRAQSRDAAAPSWAHADATRNYAYDAAGAAASAAAAPYERSLPPSGPSAPRPAPPPAPGMVPPPLPAAPLEREDDEDAGGSGAVRFLDQSWTAVLQSAAGTDLLPFLRERESRALVLCGCAGVPMDKVKMLLERYGRLYYLRDEFAARGAIFVGYYDLRAATAAQANFSRDVQRLQASSPLAGAGGPGAGPAGPNGGGGSGLGGGPQQPSAVPAGGGGGGGQRPPAAAYFSVMLHGANTHKEGVLVVRELPPHVTENEVLSAFQAYGGVRSVCKQISLQPSRPGYFVIDYYDVQDAQRAADGLRNANPWGQRIVVEPGAQGDKERHLAQQLLQMLVRWREDARQAAITQQATARRQQQQHQHQHQRDYSSCHRGCGGCGPVDCGGCPNGGGGSCMKGHCCGDASGTPATSANTTPSTTPGSTPPSGPGTYGNVNGGTNCVGNAVNGGGAGRGGGGSGGGGGRGQQGAQQSSPQDTRNELHAALVAQGISNGSGSGCGGSDGHGASGSDGGSAAGPSRLQFIGSHNGRPIYAGPSGGGNGGGRGGRSGGVGGGGYYNDYSGICHQRSHSSSAVLEDPKGVYMGGHGGGGLGGSYLSGPSTSPPQQHSPRDYTGSPPTKAQSPTATGGNGSSNSGNGVFCNYPCSGKPGMEQRHSSGGGVGGGIPSAPGMVRRESCGPAVGGGGGSACDEFGLDVKKIAKGADKRTTIMIRNIPNKYTQAMLLREIDANYREAYDFFYLPIDFKNKCNVGYAFINFMDFRRIVPFFREFNGQRWKNFNSEKVCAITYARIQGKASMISRFQNSSLMEKDGEYRPLLFCSNGTERGRPEPFPCATKARRSFNICGGAGPGGGGGPTGAGVIGPREGLGAIGTHRGNGIDRERARSSSAAPSLPF